MINSRVVKQLKKLPLLESVDKELWERLTPVIDSRDLAAGETLFKAGRKSDDLYMIVDGEIGLHLPYNDSNDTFYLQSRYKGDTAGDFAVLNGGELLVNAIAIKKTRVATFPRSAFERLADLDPKILAHVYDVAANLSRSVTLSRAFLELFGVIDTDTMNELLKVTTVHHYHSGQVLFEEGAEAKGLYVVLSGRMSVETTDIDGQKQRMAVVKAPETVGELALLADTRRSATVMAARESSVARLDKGSFNALIAPHASMLMSLSRLVVRRHVANVRATAQYSSDQNFVLVPLDDGLPLRRFVSQLKREMRKLGTTLALDANGFDTLYGKANAAQTEFEDIFNAAVAEWLDDKENRFDSIIYVADPEWTPWTRRCVNRADRVLYLASAHVDNDDSIRDIEANLNGRFAASRIRPMVDLILLHAPETLNPKNTARWLQSRQLDAFHHVRMGDDSHFSRLARRLSGQARGIVLSGGGARGYAHLGVQRLIEEQNIEIDYVGGASMGGLLGASMAMGRKYAEIDALSAIFANKQALFDYTLPVVALMKSMKLSRFCREVYGDLQIEDLWVPFFCVSSNLADGREVVHDRGPLWKVVRSTISIPGVFSPVPTPNGDLLIDGAVLNTFPVDIMVKRLGSKGKIIGVNVSHIPEQFCYYDFDTSLSGWSVLLSRVNPFSQRIRVPRIAETLLRSTDIKGIERMNETKAMLDILIEPNVRSISLLDFKSYKRISEIGYEEARRIFARHGLCEPLEPQLDSDEPEAMHAAVTQTH